MLGHRAGNPSFLLKEFSAQWGSSQIRRHLRCEAGSAVPRRSRRALRKPRSPASSPGWGRGPDVVVVEEGAGLQRVPDRGHAVEHRPGCLVCGPCARPPPPPPPPCSFPVPSTAPRLRSRGCVCHTLDYSDLLGVTSPTRVPVPYRQETCLLSFNSFSSAERSAWEMVGAQEMSVERRVSRSQFLLLCIRAMNSLSRDALVKGNRERLLSFCLSFWPLVFRGDPPFLRQVCQACTSWQCGTQSDLWRVSVGCLRVSGSGHMPSPL